MEFTQAQANYIADLCMNSYFSGLVDGTKNVSNHIQELLVTCNNDQNKASIRSLAIKNLVIKQED